MPCRMKYGITEERVGFRGTMKLIVRKFSPSDVGTYHCVSTNSLGRAEGTLRLYGKWYLQFSPSLRWAASAVETDLRETSAPEL